MSVEGPIELPPGAEVIQSGLEMIAATGMQIAPVANDFVITFTRPSMGQVVIDGIPQGVAKINPVAEILMSAANLKEVVIVLTGIVAQHEQQFGVIETAFTRQREKQGS